eukprot:1544057-Amphidinium_carterae.2
MFQQYGSYDRSGRLQSSTPCFCPTSLAAWEICSPAGPHLCIKQVWELSPGCKVLNVWHESHDESSHTTAIGSIL